MAAVVGMAKFDEFVSIKFINFNSFVFVVVVVFVSQAAAVVAFGAELNLRRDF